MHVEGVLHEVDLRGLAGQEVELHDVEAVGRLPPEHAEPVAGAAADELAFGVVHHAGGRAGGWAGAAFHLGEHQGVSLAADDIHLTAGAEAEVAVEDAVAVGAQPGGRHLLAVAADEPARRDGVRVPGAAPFVQQAQTSGDGVE